MDLSNLLPLSGLPPKTFETIRLKLRLIEPTDGQLLFDLYASDPVTSRYMSFKVTGRLEDTQFFVDNSCRYSLGEPSPVKHHSWLVYLKETGEPMGTAGFGPKNTHTLAGGYVFGQKFWGKGYASEAWKCLVDWAKTQPGVYRIEATHHPDNPASGKVMVNAGMSYEGILKREAISPNVSDEPGDSVLYAWARP